MKLIKAIGMLFVIFGLVCSCVGVGLLDQTSAQAGASLSQLDASSWSYRQQITIKGSPDGALTNYQMKLTVHKGGGTSAGSDVYLNNHCQDDFSDIRFTASDGTTLLDYWIENFSNGNISTVWVEIDSIPASPSPANFYLYYGNADARNAGQAYAEFWGVANGDFETGSYSGWSTVTTSTEVFGVSNASWSIKHNAYYNSVESSGPSANGEYGEISQSVNLADVSHLNFQLGARLYGERTRMDIYVDNELVYQKILSGSNNYPDQRINISSYGFTGSHTIRFRAVKISGDWPAAWRLDFVRLRNLTANEPALGIWGSEEQLGGSDKLTGVQIGLLSFGLVLMLLGISVLFKGRAKMLVSGAVSTVEKVKLMPARTKGMIILLAGVIVVVIAIILVIV